MKKACLLLASLLMATTAPSSKASDDPDDPAERWASVDTAMKEGLPRTALERLQPILDNAVRDGDTATAARAISRRILIESEIEGRNPAARVRLADAALAETPPSLHPILHTLRAWYLWAYYQQNRWRFLHRITTDAAPGDDFEAWDLPRIMAEIAASFDRALAASDELKKLPVGDFSAFLEMGPLPESYRPTLYDIIAYEAIDFFTSAEEATTLPQDAFVLQADSPVLSDVGAFLAWQPETTDTTAGGYRAIRLFQELMRFHRDDADRTAFLDADLARITWAMNAAAGPSALSRGRTALENFVEANAAHELSAAALHALASTYQADDPAKAHAFATRGANAYPESRFGQRCLYLARQIELPALAVESERVWNAAGPDVSVTYRNLDYLHFRLIPLDWEKEARAGRYSNPEILDPTRFEQIKKMKPVREWSANLPPTPDYRERSEHITPPDDIPPGFYALVASSEPDLSRKENHLATTAVWVSDLALITRPEIDAVGGFVLHAITGEPVSGASVVLFPYDTSGRLHRARTTKTDANAHFSVPRGSDQQPGFLFATATVEGAPQALASMDQQSPGTLYHSDGDSRQVFFFTDRALYRPGQTVRFKGIALRADEKKSDYHTLANNELEIEFLDPNNERIETLTVVTNEKGGFSGAFTAPTDRGTGEMTLNAVGVPVGSTTVDVEEYKRPRFFTEIPAPGEPARLGEVVRVRGVATTYADAPVDGAKVAWRVTREIEWPFWFRFFPASGQSNQEIAHGITTTGPDGSYEIEFTPDPAPDADLEGEPVFSFALRADVTDGAGETRSAERFVRVGYTAVRATVSADEWQTPAKPVEFTILATSLDDEPRDVSGTLRVVRLEEPEHVHRPPLSSFTWRFAAPRSRDAEDLSDPENWADGEVVAELPFTTEKGVAKLTATPGTGIFRVIVEVPDLSARPATARALVRVVDPTADKLSVPVPSQLVAEGWRFEPGTTFTALWGSGYDSARAYVEFLRDREVIKSFWTDPDVTQQRLELPIEETMRGGIGLRTTFVRENRATLETRVIEVPWTNKELKIRWERFTSKLEPGAKETWTAVIEGPDAEATAAEMVATLYDASLDEFLPHGWMDKFPVFRREFNPPTGTFQNNLRNMDIRLNGFRVDLEDPSVVRTQFPPNFTGRRGWGSRRGGSSGSGFRTSSSIIRSQAPTNFTMQAVITAPAQSASFAESVVVEESDADSEPPPIDPSTVTARTNLEETAFFFPDLIAGDDGTIRMEFTTPEALTTWRFLGFAHDTELRAGLLEGTAVTSKDLMVQPNPPRFLREGDAVEFTVKITNKSDKPQSGTARLNFFDAETKDAVDTALGLTTPDQTFEVPANSSKTLSWPITVPDGSGFLTYRAVAATADLSDGEEGWLPVLSRRVLVTESLPLPIRGPATKEFQFEKLLTSGDSDSIESQSLVVQMTSNPAWYAVMALPYLMEFPYQCSEQIFSRFYANSLARHIAKSDPKIAAVFETWRGTDALDSPLEKNEDIKGIALEETPWLRDAKSESEARRNVGLLFEEARMDREITRAYEQLSEAQYPDGTWPWFPGGRGDDFVTLHIVTGFGRLHHLGVPVQVDLAIRAIRRLDDWIVERYRELRRDNDQYNDHVPRPIEALYLYARSFFLKHQPIPEASREAVDFFLGQARKFWLKTDNRMTQAHLALALQRFGDNETPAAIMASLKERAVVNDELGMFWKDSGPSWWWYRAPIETQALLIEAFDEITDDTDAVEDLRVWLLKQKQTQNWRTTKATADAVYGLLLRGTDLLASDQLVNVTVGELDITPPADNPGVESGTGMYERRFTADEIQPEFGRVTVTKDDDGVAWGGIHWQYLADIAAITPHDETPLRLKKTIFRRENTPRGPVLKEIDGPLAPGDELIVRIELRTDRAMEYLHLKDARGSGTEPVNVLSGRRLQDGLSYYESTRDAASHFFIDRINPGTYVFEYPLRVQLRGTYQSGIAEVMCMYAPEFNAHSASTPLNVE